MYFINLFTNEYSFNTFVPDPLLVPRDIALNKRNISSHGAYIVVGEITQKK